ncbi:Hypothetical predicted protein [Mytilus galloprovincialis]|uniref:Uncharacterized protein n=1 Tax=Mytilus galloprovincialis TaxID=29158 RepID=A0A8B6GVV1_MYTGA|nr:Hypothetical predicted protein [Mytilus galloprovincialis]
MTAKQCENSLGLNVNLKLKIRIVAALILHSKALPKASFFANIVLNLVLERWFKMRIDKTASPHWHLQRLRYNSCSSGNISSDYDSAAVVCKEKIKGQFRNAPIAKLRQREAANPDLRIDMTASMQNIEDEIVEPSSSTENTNNDNLDDTIPCIIWYIYSKIAVKYTFIKDKRRVQQKFVYQQAKQKNKREVQPEVQQSEVAQPEVAEPEPEVAEPAVAKPEVAEPEVAEQPGVETQTEEPEQLQQPHVEQQPINRKIYRTIKDSNSKTGDDEIQPITLENVQGDDNVDEINEEDNTSDKSTIQETVDASVSICKPNNINDHLDILRICQDKIVLDKKLNIVDDSDVLTGVTNNIMVDRDNILKSAITETCQIRVGQGLSTLTEYIRVAGYYTMNSERKQKDPKKLDMYVCRGPGLGFGNTREGRRKERK